MTKHAEHHAKPDADPKLHPPGADDASNAVKDPDNWTTGEESMTGAQASYLKTLCEEAHAEFDAGLNKAEASKRIDELRHKTGRGINH